MSKAQMMRDLVNQRLSAAAEEIFELFERTIAEYEEKLLKTKENQQNLMDAVFNPVVRLNRTDVEQLIVIKENSPPEQQLWSSSLHHNDKQDPPLIKQEPEELWTNQEGKQLQELEEAHITQTLFIPVPVSKEEKPPSLQLCQIGPEESTDAEHLKTDADGEECERSEPDRTFNPDTHVQHLPSVSYHSETDDRRYYWGEMSEHPSGLNSLQPTDDPVGNTGCNTGGALLTYSKRPRIFLQKKQLHTNSGTQRERNVFSCSVCGKQYSQEISLTRHLSRHARGRCVTCSVCKKSFPFRGELVRHMRIHTGEKPFSCSICGMRFSQKATVKSHLQVHTGVKPFSCSICKASFGIKSYMRIHMRVHTGEKPFGCDVCGKRFTRRGAIQKHRSIHAK